VPITLSGLSRLQDRPDSFWKAYQTSAYAIGAVLAPACILLTLAPAECLGYVFGAQWIPAAPVMRTTALLFLLYPLARTTHSGFLALGRPDLLFRWLLVATALLVAGFLVGQRWGLQGITVGMVLAQTVSLPVGLFAFATQGRTTVAALFKPVVPVMAATLTVGLIAFPFTRMAGPVTVTAWPRLAIALAAVAAFGLFMAFHVKHSASGQLITKTLHPSLPPALRPWLARLAGLPTPPSPL
jgi:PST family polysaccharide transporter